MKPVDMYHQVSFLPWLEWKTPARLGPIQFWYYYEKAEEVIQDESTRDHLTKYFQSYVDQQGAPLQNITICSYGESNFRPFGDDELQVLRSTIDTLIFATIAPQAKAAVCAENRSMGPPSADTFELITQNFEVGSDHIAVRAGSVLSGGWKIGEIRFPKPWATGGGFGSPNEDLIKGFDKCFSPEFPEEVRERLFRSLEWFRLAHIEGGHVSWLSKLVMMATAFEILLQFPRERKAKYFVEYIEKNIAQSEFFRDKRIDYKGKSHDLSLAGCWAWDFYELRSRIVHGDHVRINELIYKDWITHLIVADLIFWESVTRELFNQKCIGEDIRNLADEWEKAFPDPPTARAEESLARWFLAFNEVHRALGWVPKKEYQDCGSR